MSTRLCSGRIRRLPCNSSLAFKLTAVELNFVLLVIKTPLLMDDSGQWFQTSLLPFRFPCKSAGADGLRSSSLQRGCTGWFGGMSMCCKEHWYTGCFQPLVRVREGKLVSQRCTASWCSRSHDLLYTELLLYFLYFQSFPAIHEAGSKPFRVLAVKSNFLMPSTRAPFSFPPPPQSHCSLRML